ncbi:bifunctional hydroxymethylpyrimidine kinase/phosphomethylpyrimidine kinase [Deinococcus multiflagellatus]
MVVDDLRAGEHRFTLTAPRQPTRHTHGTGCTLSAAITAQLARGQPLPDAVRLAHAYLQAALRHAPGLGAGHGPLGHARAAQGHAHLSASAGHGLT